MDRMKLGRGLPILFAVATFFAENPAAAQDEPRTPISSLPYTINQPGSYYVTKNLTGSGGQSGITIEANNVTLDLMGFSLEGVAGSWSGIELSSQSPVQNVTIRNGIISGWGQSGLSGHFDANSRAESLQVSDNGSDGLALGTGATVVGCMARNNLVGIRCGDACALRDSTAVDNQLGFDVGDGSTISGSVALRNAHDGFQVHSGTTLSNCTARGNQGIGITSVENDVIVAGCIVTANGTGIRIGHRGFIRDSAVVLNQVHGIWVEDDSVLTANDCTLNGTNKEDAAIRVAGSRNRIEGNSLKRNKVGLRVESAGNLVIRNSASVNDDNYQIANGNSVGPIVNSLMIATDNNPHANYVH